MTKAKGKNRRVSDTAIWGVTILTLAISCAALSMLISENQELQRQNDLLIGADLSS